MTQCQTQVSASGPLVFEKIISSNQTMTRKYFKFTITQLKKRFQRKTMSPNRNLSW